MLRSFKREINNFQIKVLIYIDSTERLVLRPTKHYLYRENHEIECKDFVCDKLMSND